MGNLDVYGVPCSGGPTEGLGVTLIQEMKNMVLGMKPG